MLEILQPVPGKIYFDGTLGGGGHARDLLDRILPDGQLIGTDLDEDSVIHARAFFSGFSGRTRIFHDNYSNLPTILEQCSVAGVHGIVLDLGLSLHHLEQSNRGFSFLRDEPLDMRMNKSGNRPTAGHVVNSCSQRELARIFREYGEERFANKVAWRIVKQREKSPITTSLQLAGIVAGAMPGKKGRVHPATRVFQALRIHVNAELFHLELFLDSFMDCLLPGGRLCVISFHSLEDRPVKRRFVQLAKGCTCPPDFPQCVCGKKPEARVLTKRVIRPSELEVEKNPMSRSAKLRAIEKLPEVETGTGHE